MADKHAFIAMVQIETDDPLLSAAALSRATVVNTAANAAATRRAVLTHLPHDVTRLVAVLPVEQARMLMMLHEAVGEDIGAPGFVRPPADYSPPKRG